MNVEQNTEDSADTSFTGTDDIANGASGDGANDSQEDSSEIMMTASTSSSNRSHQTYTISQNETLAGPSIALSNAEAEAMAYQGRLRDASRRQRTSAQEERAWHKFMNTKLERDKLPEDTPLPIYLSYREPRKLSPKPRSHRYREDELTDEEDD